VPRLECSSAAFDQFALKRAAVSHLRDSLALRIFGRLDLREHRAVSDVGNQYPVVDLADPQRRLVLEAAGLSPRHLCLGARDVVCGFHPEELSQRLNDASAVGDRTHATLIEDQRLPRNRRDPDRAEPAGGNFDQLCIRQMEEGRLVSHLWKVIALGDVLRAVLLVDRQLREPDPMIVCQRQVDGFGKRDAPGRRGLGLLRECRTRRRGEEQ
jgi:hypothetical protein